MASYSFDTITTTSSLTAGGSTKCFVVKNILPATTLPSVFTVSITNNYTHIWDNTVIIYKRRIEIGFFTASVKPLDTNLGDIDHDNIKITNIVGTEEQVSYVAGLSSKELSFCFTDLPEGTSTPYNPNIYNFRIYKNACKYISRRR